MDHRDILIDAARRPVASARQVLKEIGADALNRMPDGEHSSIAWLIWHAARQQDAQMADMSGTDQVWQAQGWAQRFGVDRPVEATGFGDSPAEVSKLRVADPVLLSGYLEAVVARVIDYVAQTVADGPGRHRRRAMGPTSDSRRAHRQHHR
jgi:DinB superfamily